MKALTPFLCLFILSMLSANNSMAQKAIYTNNGGMSIGIGGGYAYQKSDLLNSRGYGFDLTLGSQLYYKENAFLGVDWKFRFLAGVNKAYDHRINPDDTYSNIRYNFFTYDLELGLTLNRLRERTGIVLTGFIGAGITHGRTFTDLYDAGNNLYDFSSIDPNQDSKSVYDDLVALSDGDFETSLVNKAAFLPTAGLFVGYQLSRSMTLGIEYKTNFYLTEENGFAGIDLDNRIMDGSGIDRNNYVSLGIRWNLRGGSSRRSATTNYSNSGTTNLHNTSGTENRLVNTSSLQPSVKITEPVSDPYQTATPSQTIRATIHNVSGSDNISFYQNGYPNNNFTYNVNTLTFIANVRLREGENYFRISATNQTSTAEDEATITHEIPPEPVNTTPSAEFISPWRSQVTSSSDRMDITARVKNISSKQNILLTQDEKNIPFEFSPDDGLVSTSILLTEGDNLLSIEGSNESGSAQDQLSVLFNIHEPMPLPRVRFVNPHIPVEVGNNRFPLKAETQNVHGRDDLTLTLNGANINNFSFSSTGVVSVGLVLPAGINTLEITAWNEAGFASDRTSITYYEPVYHDPVRQEPIYREPVIINDPPVITEERRPCTPPAIRLINPVQDQISTREQRYPLRAEVRNISNSSQLNLTVNGKAIAYTFNNNQLSSPVPLASGLNSLSIKARNECGEDQILTRISYIPAVTEEPCNPPTVSFTLHEVDNNSATHELRGLASGVGERSGISLTVNDKVKKAFQFVPASGDLSARFNLTPGSHKIVVSVRNACGTDNQVANLSIEEPCTPPKVSFTLHEVDRADATHELSGTITGVKNKADISITLDDRANNGFQFSPTTGLLSAKYKLSPGSHTIVVSANNACGGDSKKQTVSVMEVVEEACGPRFNPGNSAWQFCLVTPSGTFTRDDLTNLNFRYSGRATSIYFKPIAGGGDVMVNGRPYPVKSGQYYLFTGNLQVTVSTKNPGSMGHWSVCLSADKAPQSGNGNMRPKSPCEEEKKDPSKGKGNRR